MNSAYTPVVRALIQVFAGILAKRGYDIGSDIEPVVSVVIMAGSLLWSIREKNQIKKSATN